MDAAAIVHISAIFAVAIIVIIEIRLGRNSGTWAPLLSTLIGYVLPQPKLRNSATIVSNTPTVAPTAVAAVEVPADAYNLPCLKRLIGILYLTWPSLLLVGSAIAWLIISAFTQSAEQPLMNTTFG